MRLTPLSQRTFTIAGLALLLGSVVGWAAKEDAKSAFSSPVIDLGVVVSDIEKSAKFYTAAIGFEEVEGFDVPASLAGDSGLTDNRPFHVRAFVLNKGGSPTKLKLIQFKDAPGKKNDQAFIQSSLGFRYLTIHVNDMTSAVDRAAKQGVKLLAKSPVALPEGFPQGVYLTLVKDPDGNFVELVGPKK